jgi:hypothetical protein
MPGMLLLFCVAASTSFLHATVCAYKEEGSALSTSQILVEMGPNCRATLNCFLYFSLALQVRELVLSSVNNLLLAKAPMVKSGWRPLLAVFAIAAALENEEALSQQAYNCVHRLVQSHFVLLVHDFRHLVACLLAFVRGPYTEVALGALNLLHHCAANLAKEGFVPELSTHTAPASLSSSSSQGASNDSATGAAAGTAAAALLPPLSPSSLMVRSDSAASATSSLSTIVDATSPLVHQGRGRGEGREKGVARPKKGRRFSVSPPPWARRAIRADLKRLRRICRRQRSKANDSKIEFFQSSRDEKGDDEEVEERVDGKEEKNGEAAKEEEEEQEEVNDEEENNENDDGSDDENNNDGDDDDSDESSDIDDFNDMPFDWGGNAWPSASEQAECPHLSLWWSILVGLAHQIVDERLTVRRLFLFYM